MSKVHLGYRIQYQIGREYDEHKALELCKTMKKIAVDACETEEEKLAIKDMTLAKLHDFGVLCMVGRNPYPTHAFNLLTDNTNRAAKIQCALFKGKTRDIFIDRKEFTGPIYEQVDDAYNFVLRHIDMGVEIEGEYRKDMYELPISAIRETIANAVLHRSYLDRSCVQVCIYDDRLEVSSPGMLYGGLDIETAKTGKSTCRNEAIAEAFHYMHIVEAWGTGIPRIINRCNEYGLPDPVFEEFGDGFKVTLFRKVSNASEKVSNASEKVSNAFDNYIPLLKAAGATDIFINNIGMVYEYCNSDTPFGQANVMAWLECSKSKATNIMNALKKANVIEKVKGLGAGRYKFVNLQD